MAKILDYQFVFAGDHCRLQEDTYQDNGRLAIFITYLDDEFNDWLMHSKISVNIPDEECPPNHFWVKTWSENTKIVTFLESTNLFIKTDKLTIVGHGCVAELWKRR